MKKRYNKLPIYLTALLSLIVGTGIFSRFPRSFGRTHFVEGITRKQVRSWLSKGASQGTHTEANSYIGGTQVLFSPDDDICSTLKHLISQAEKNIELAVYIITDSQIAQALLAAKRRGIAIEVVTEGTTCNDRFSKIYQLEKEQIPIYVYKSNKQSLFPGIMHDKFIIFDGKKVMTGSFNFTKAAGKRNQENVIISGDPAVVAQFKKQFDILKKRSIQKK